MTSPLVCPRGYFCPENSSSTSPCPIGTYNNLLGLSKVEDCAPCDLGHFCPSRGLPGPLGKCNAGHVCRGKARTNDPQDQDYGTTCEKGHYCPSGACSGVWLCFELLSGVFFKYIEVLVFKCTNAEIQGVLRVTQARNWETDTEQLYYWQFFKKFRKCTYSTSVPFINRRNCFSHKLSVMKGTFWWFCIFLSMADLGGTYNPSGSGADRGQGG